MMQQDCSSLCLPPLRRSIRRGESVKYLLPDAVIDYIFEHRLYAQPEYGLEPPERPLAEL